MIVNKLLTTLKTQPDAFGKTNELELMTSTRVQLAQGYCSCEGDSEVMCQYTVIRGPGFHGYCHVNKLYKYRTPDHVD